jgi:hypothetical protein
MKTTLLRRIEVLEQQVPDPRQPAKSIVPEWLLDAWQAQGLQFDRTNNDSIRRAFASRAAAG